MLAEARDGGGGGLVSFGFLGGSHASVPDREDRNLSVADAVHDTVGLVDNRPKVRAILGAPHLALFRKHSKQLRSLEEPFENSLGRPRTITRDVLEDLANLAAGSL